MPHTPAPWTWTEGWGSDDICTGILGPEREMVVEPIEGDGDPAFRCSPGDIRLIAQAPAMYELLKEIASRSVFTDPSGGVISQCLICGAIGRGHSSDCRLAAVLKAVEGEESA